MSLYFGFHDSLIVAANYKSGAYVNEKGSLYFGRSEDRELTITFHSQWEPRILELCFTGVRRFHIKAWNEDYFFKIFEASLVLLENSSLVDSKRVFVWTDSEYFSEEEMKNMEGMPWESFVIADAVKWRTGK